MIPHNPHREQINPRALVLKEGPEALWRLMESAGYIPQEEVFSDFIKALLNHLPWRITGIRGGGKTAFPNALATCCNLDHWGVTGREDIKDEELLYSWDRDEQSEWMNEARARKIPLEEAIEKKWTKQYLILGEVLGAYDAAATSDCPPLLFMDELCKLTLGQQNFLLQPLQNGVMFIPRLRPTGFVGCPDESKRPIVISASNDKIKSAPLRSRYLFTPIQTPDNKKEVEILYKHVPESSTYLLKLVVKILDAVRAVPGIDDPPALRESIHMLKAMNRDRVEKLSEGMLTSYLCFLVKEAEDRAYLMTSLPYIEASAVAPHSELDAWVDYVVGQGEEILSLR